MRGRSQTRVPLAGPEKVINHQTRFVNLPQTQQIVSVLEKKLAEIYHQKKNFPPTTTRMRPRGYLCVQRKTNSGQSNFRHHY